MAGVMLVRQKAPGVARWNAVSRDPVLDAARRQHGLVMASARATAIGVPGGARGGQGGDAR